MNALGITPDEAQQRRQQTGVDPGGTGYVSGQVPPGGSTGGAPGTAGGGSAANPGLGAFGAPSGGSSAPGTPRGATSTPGAPTPPLGSSNTAPGSGGLTSSNAAQTGRIATPGGDTTTKTGALTAPTPPGGGTAPPPPGSYTGNGTGTTSYSPFGGPAYNAVTSVPIVGPLVGGLTSTPVADLGPTKAAQAAAMGLSGNLNQERYNYRPGEAPAQDRVQLDTAQENEIRGRQQGALDALQAASEGRVPSAAEIQMREEAGRNTAAALGMARALGGRSAGGAARAGTLAASDILSRNAVEGAAQRAAEQANARNAYTTALGGVRTQDIGTSEANANLGQQANANNLQAQTQANQLAEQHRQALLKAQLDALGIGEKAAGETVQASAKNADTEGKYKGGLIDTATSLF